MAKRNEVYKCPECGNIVEVLVPTDKEVCGFKLLKENTTDAATEKHVPVVEKIDGGYRVTVGEVEHPMTEAHYIEWIYLKTDKALHAKELHPNEEPKAAFLLEENEKPLEVYAYCNLHGLYLKKIA